MGVGLGSQKGFGSGVGWELGIGLEMEVEERDLGLGVRGGVVNAGRHRVSRQEAWGVVNGKGRGQNEGWAWHSRGRRALCTLYKKI